MTNDGRRAPFRRYECAKDKRQRHLRSDGRLRLHLCRDAARVAAHRGGHDSHVNTTHTSTQTDIEYVASESCGRIRGSSTVFILCSTSLDRTRGHSHQ